VIKNGSIHTGKQKFLCKECRRQFVEQPTKKMISQDTWELVEKLLLEKIPLAGISRVTGMSERWLQTYVNAKYQAIPREVTVSPQQKGRLTIACDEMWSFVGKKERKYWIWLAINRTTREIIGAYVGSRDREGAQGLWDSLPPVYRQCAVAYTDFWAAYANVFPSKRHKAVGKESGHTSHIERLNCTIRQRVSRLVRKTLSFSKKVRNHIGALWNVIHHYNAEIAACR
jgi:IS1 family transposase